MEIFGFVLRYKLIIVSLEYKTIPVPPLPLETWNEPSSAESRQSCSRQDQGEEVRLLRQVVRQQRGQEGSHDEHPLEAEEPRVFGLPQDVRGPSRHGQPYADGSRDQGHDQD